MRKILLVEDDISLGETLNERLKRDYEVAWAKNLSEAWSLFSKAKDFDLAILDVGLPDGSGFELAAKIRQTSPMLFLFLTAQADAESRLKGFELGAEEYIPKPFHLKELLIRVKHVLDAHAPTRELQLDTCTVNFTQMSVTKKTGQIEYPPVTDLKILQLLIEKSPRVLSRDEIMNEIWGVDKNPSHRTIDNIIVRLRQLLGDDGEKHIRSVRGVGYQWSTEEAT
ncbi:response regulator transcription factor [Bdellovibrio bacteriovorus]|uniref:response regulator transcription factor n=1 Tax=Bdellovibrio bacteriovorus TaxID=959 RepID=UPI0021D3639D|nr:response regulator transcription factor [Bdellovibrio bacteriovorus]UXR64222.1 response regulator transcription factor [Bdellovibrio bacteriovorus]